MFDIKVDKNIKVFSELFNDDKLEEITLEFLSIKMKDIEEDTLEEKLDKLKDVVESYKLYEKLLSNSDSST